MLKALLQMQMVKKALELSTELYHLCRFSRAESPRERTDSSARLNVGCCERLTILIMPETLLVTKYFYILKLPS